jgi:hypothetical protein
MSSLFSILTIAVDAISLIWTLVDRFSNFVLGLAGFPSDEDDERHLPIWVGWTALLALLGVAGLLIYTGFM